MSKFTLNKSPIPGVLVIDLEPMTDERGSFSRIYCEKDFSEAGITEHWVQVNQSFNLKKGTFRGMHYQVPPHSEVKLVRCVSGAVLDFMIDLRANSETFLKTFQVELSARNFKMLLIPKGIAHGFITLEDHTTLVYHHSDFFNAESARGIRYNDPRINIQLPMPISVISKNDEIYPPLPPDFSGLRF